MSVIVKSMEMPQNCAFCPLSKYRNTSLGLILDCKRIGTVGTAFRDTHNVLEHRHPDCPLIEVKGRLINADKLMMSLADWWYSSFGQTETEKSKAIKTVLDKIENSIDLFAVAEGETDA